VDRVSFSCATGGQGHQLLLKSNRLALSPVTANSLLLLWWWWWWWWSHTMLAQQLGEWARESTCRSSFSMMVISAITTGCYCNCCIIIMSACYGCTYKYVYTWPRPFVSRGRSGSRVLVGGTPRVHRVSDHSYHRAAQWDHAPKLRCSIEITYQYNTDRVSVRRNNTTRILPIPLSHSSSVPA